MSSIPTESYDLEFPEQIVVPAGTQKMDFSVRADHNYDNESDRTVILKAEGENGTAAQEEIKILDDDSLQNNDGVLQLSAGGLDNDTDGDGVFEAGEDAEYEVWFQRTGSDSPQSSISFSILNDPRNNLRLLDGGLLYFGHAHRFRAEPHDDIVLRKSQVLRRYRGRRLLYPDRMEPPEARTHRP